MIRGKVVVEAEPIGVDRLVFDSLVGRVVAEELLLIGRAIELLRVHQHRPRVESVDLPIVDGPHRLVAFERAAGVGPIEGRYEPFGTVDQLLATTAKRQLPHWFSNSWTSAKRLSISKRSSSMARGW